MTRLFFALFLCLTLPNSLTSQIKVVRGSSDAQSGMLYYDIEKANDKKEKQFLYTICPDQARCMQLDFTLVSSALESDFIRLYAGDNADGEPIQSLGGKSLDRLVQYSGSCITVEFLRDHKGLNTAWTLLWKSDLEGDCIRSGEVDDDCPYITEICGPEYRENFRYFNEARVASQAVMGSCLDQPKRSSWYKFQAQQNGQLQFSILPHNGIDDYDWVLWRADSTWTDPCPDSLLLTQKLACNYASGRGQTGSTGMDVLGTSLETTASGNPFARPVEARKGDVFFLLVNDYSRKSQGFTIRMNEVVLACDNPIRAFVPINHQPVTGRPKIPSRNAFSRYTRILRIDLNEKINRPMGMCDAGEIDWERSVGEFDKPMTAGLKVPGSGIHGAILNGLKLGLFQGYACEDMATPIHYGDLIHLLKRQGVEANWEMSTDALASFGNYIELIVDEIFDRTSGRKRQELRMVRLVWSPSHGDLPDMNIAVFQWEEIVDILDQVWVPNPHNDVNSLSLRDFIEGQMYSSINVHQRNADNRNKAEAERGEVLEVEFEAYHWGQ